MSVAVSQHKNFVGGEWVDSAGGETMEVLNPSTGEVIAEVARSTAEDANSAVEAAKNALPEWLETTPGERAEHALQARRPDRGERRGACGPRVQERRQAPVLRAGRDARVRGQHPLLRRCGTRARRPRGRRVHAGLHLHAPARADRHRRRHRSLELPAHDGRLEVLARARGRERPGAEAVRADSALASPLHGARRRRDPAGRAQRHHRRRRARRRGSRQASRGAPRLPDRRRRDRQGHCAGRLRTT